MSTFNPLRRAWRDCCAHDVLARSGRPVPRQRLRWLVSAIATAAFRSVTAQSFDEASAPG